MLFIAYTGARRPACPSSSTRHHSSPLAQQRDGVRGTGRREPRRTPDPAARLRWVAEVWNAGVLAAYVAALSPPRQARTGIVSARRVADAASLARWNSAMSSITGRTRTRPTRRASCRGPIPPSRGAEQPRIDGSGELAGMAVDERGGRRVVSRPHESPLPRSDHQQNIGQRGLVERVQHRRAPPDQPQPAPSASSRSWFDRRHQVEQPAVVTRPLGTGPPRATAPRRARRQAACSRPSPSRST